MENIGTKTEERLKQIIDNNEILCLGFLYKHFKRGVNEDETLTDVLIKELDNSNVAVKKEFCDMLNNYLGYYGIRTCSHCGKLISDAYFLNGGYYACSDECAVELFKNRIIKNYEKKELKETEIF